MKTTHRLNLLACALARAATSAWAQNTPGYNNEIPQQIMAPAGEVEAFQPREQRAL
jgi:hypothetical protein